MRSSTFREEYQWLKEAIRIHSSTGATPRRSFSKTKVPRNSKSCIKHSACNTIPLAKLEEAMVRDLAAIQRQISRLDGWMRRAFELDDRVASEIGQLPFNIIVELAKTTNEKANILLLEQRAKALNFAHQLAEINPALDNVGRILKLREQLERSFDKGVSRIANAKEFKKLYGAKLIELLPQAERTSISLDEIDDDRAKESKNVPKLNGGETA